MKDKDRRYSVHYFGGLEITKGGKFSEHARGWPACSAALARKMMEDRTAVAGTFEVHRVTCLACLKLMTKAGLIGLETARANGQVTK